MSTPIIPIPNFSDEVLQNLNDMRQNSDFTDVILVCGKKKFDAHRSHLSAASAYLHSLFKNNINRSSEGMIEIQTIPPHSLETILDILYTGKLPSLDQKPLQDVLIASHHLQLQNIFLCYREVFLSQFSSKNCLSYWEIGETLGDDEVLKTVYSNLEKTYLTPEFQTMDIRDFQKMFQSMLSRVQESHTLVMKVIVSWISRNEEDRSQFFDELIRFIDLKKVSNDVLSDVTRYQFVVQSKAFQNKYNKATYHGFGLFYSFPDDSLLSNIFLYGQHKKGKSLVQKFALGNWERNIYLEEKEYWKKIKNSGIIVCNSKIFIFGRCRTVDKCLLKKDKKMDKKNVVQCMKFSLVTCREKDSAEIAFL